MRVDVWGPNEAAGRMRIGIIGGGVSGLTAAWMLARQGCRVEVFEQAEAVGGLASTFDFGGVRLEKYYHFLCRGDEGYISLCRELEIGDRIRWVRSRTGFFYEGRGYPFTTAFDLLRFKPIPLRQRIRFGLFALEAGMRKEWRQLDELPAKPWLIDRLGRRTYEVVWRPLLALKFGERHETISAAWVWHRLHRVARSKGKLGYLDGGAQLLLETLTSRIQAQGGVIHTGRTVRRIASSEGRVTGLEFDNGDSYECDRVVSTIPLCALANLLPEGWEAYAQQLRGIQYIGVVCVVFRLGRSTTRNFWLNVNDGQVPFNGIIEYTNLNPLSGKHGHMVYVPYYVPTDHAIYQAGDEKLFKTSWEAVKYVSKRLNDSDLEDYRVFRAPFAQAICHTGFLNALPESRAPLAGLHLLDSTFIYPEDRTQSRLILRARQCARAIGE